MRKESNFCLLLGLCLIAIVYAAPVDEEKLSFIPPLSEDAHEYKVSMAFKQFKVDYAKTYKSKEEEDARRAIFKANYERIIATNKEKRSYKLGINQFADLTEEEFRRLYLSQPEYVEPLDYVTTMTEDLEKTDTQNKDWEKEGYLNSVRDQGNCGSCWTFASIAAAEAFYAIHKNKKLIEFSEQELVDCCRTNYSNGCLGGERWDALRYIAKFGSVNREKYPYKAYQKSCAVNGLSHTKSLNGYKNITRGDNVALAKALLVNPVTIGVNASPFAFMYYKSGILDDACPSTQINHAVLLVGLGTEGGKMFWRIRNSWGPGWGDKGYIRIKRVNTNEDGVCGVAIKACTPK